VIEELHKRLVRILTMGSFRNFERSELQSDGSISRHSGLVQSYFVSVRSHNYREISEIHEYRLFQAAGVPELLRENLGFTYSEYVQVRDSLIKRMSELAKNNLGIIRNLFVKSEVDGRELVITDVEQLRTSMESMFFFPGESQTFTAFDIAKSTCLEETIVHAVLNVLSRSFGSSIKATDEVVAFLRGGSGQHQVGLVRDVNDYLVVSGVVGDDDIRRVLESASLNDSEKYLRAREQVTESLAQEIFTHLLPEAQVFAGVKYFAPKDDVSHSVLHRGCLNHKDVAKQVESDLLVVIDGVAICIEVKGKSFAQQTRRGDTSRLTQELKKTVGVGAKQAARLKSLIEINHGVWLEDLSWLDLSMIREVHTVVVGLDSFGPLAFSLGELVKAGILSADSVPWVITLHDLQVVSMILTKPEEFLLYLRRRRSRGAVQFLMVVDELDVLANFLSGQFFFEDDPRELARLFPSWYVATDEAIQRFEEYAVQTLVWSQSGSIDEWMMSDRESGEVPQPRRAIENEQLFESIWGRGEQSELVGRLPLCADFLGLSSGTQIEIGENLIELGRRTHDDKKPHSLCLSFASMEGAFGIFAISVPEEMELSTGETRLDSYMNWKSRELYLARSLGLLVNEAGQIILVTTWMRDI